MKSILAILILSAAPVLAGATLSPRNSSPGDIGSESLVRVYATSQAFDFFRPWAKKPSVMHRGLGPVVENGQVLVTAELVANHTYVELEKSGTAEKTPATVVAVDYDSNLALLQPTDPEFLSSVPALRLDSGARVGDQAMILQLESNGRIAETLATISTITITRYPLDHLGLLTYRLSTPLENRDGSFTMPAVRKGRLLGLLMRYDTRTQTANLIPAPVIQHFLEDAKGKSDPGFPRAGVAFSPTRDPQFRRYIKLKKDGGVYVTHVSPGAAADRAGLRKGDIILALNDQPIDQDGNFEDPEFGKISFSHLISTRSHLGDTLTFKIQRDGIEKSLPVTLDADASPASVSASHIFDTQPRYFILGGLVFQELSRPYLQEWGARWKEEAPQRLVYLDAYQEELPPDTGKVVFLSQVLPSPDTLGFGNVSPGVVKSVNGVTIKSLDDIARALATPVDGFHKITFEEDPGFIMLDAAAAESGRDRLMQEYGIPAAENLKSP